MAVKKKKSEEARHLESAQRIATLLKESGLADHMDLMQRPHKLAWLNFWAGVWRGLGMAVGTIVLFAVILWGLKAAVHHVGGLPWVGDQIEQFIAWLLSIIDKRQSG